MKRLTTDAPKNNIENALNLFYIKDQWAWVRGGGPAPDYADVSLCDFARMLVKSNIPDAMPPENDGDLSMMMAEWLMDEPDSAEGIISLQYTTGWAFAELRHRLAAYEDTGLDPLEIETLKTGTCLGCSVPELKEGQALHKEWEEAYQQGRLVVLPCKIDEPICIIRGEKEKYKPIKYHVVECHIDHFTVGGTGIPMITACDDKNEWYELIDGTQVGHEYWLTREEAEQAIKEEAHR